MSCLMMVNDIFGCIVWWFPEIGLPQGPTTWLSPGRNRHELTGRELENHHLQWVSQLFLWAMFNSYVKLPEGKKHIL